MDFDVPILRSNKRSAESLHPDPPTPSSSQPQVLKRHHHRRRNVAATVWGPDPIAPSPSPSHDPAPKPPFNIYKAILRHNNLFFEFALRLPYKTIVALYCIDKEFHYRLNKYSVSLIRDYSEYHAPRASYIFGWALHPELCISDPMLRPMDGRTWLARDVPGFRWVGMVLWRERVVCEILTRLAREGHRVPYAMKEAVMKYWSIMELRTMTMRLSFLMDESIWTDRDILLVQMFVVKLDMRFADPILGNGACALSHLLLKQKSLSTLWKVLTGQLKLDYDTVECMIVRAYHPRELQDAPGHMEWLLEPAETGVPADEYGVLSREEWVPGGERLESAVDMVVMEGVRRGLNAQQYYLDFALYGYVDGVTGKNIPVPVKWRDNSKSTLAKEGWPTKKERNEAIEKIEERFGLNKPVQDGDAMDTTE